MLQIKPVPKPKIIKQPELTPEQKIARAKEEVIAHVDKAFSNLTIKTDADTGDFERDYTYGHGPTIRL